MNPNGGALGRGARDQSPMEPGISGSLKSALHNEQMEHELKGVCWLNDVFGKP